MAISNDAAQKWASAAENRALLARRRASKAKGRVRSAARNGAVWKIFRFFENRTPAAWGALWYLLLSAIGVTYSWAFYSRFEGIHIFDFFGTSDFLLSAFQNVEMLVIGIIATLIGIGVLIYRAYDSIVYSAHKSNPKKRKVRILLEVLTLMCIVLIVIIRPLCYYYPSIRLHPISTSMLITGISMLIIGTNILAVLLTYRFFKRVRNPGDDRQQDQTNWEVGILLFLLLAEATLILPFLHGRSDSEAALKDKDRQVQVALRQDSVQPGTRPPKPDRTLFLGTTSSFHFFYECEEALNAGTDSKGQNDPKTPAARHQEDTPKCEKGRPFIVPTANIASLEFNPEKKEVHIPLEGQNHCGLGWEKVATIGPFPVGEHDKLMPKKFESELVTPYQLIHARRSLFEAGTPRQLMLIGRVDITPLNKNQGKYYGSNNGLAQSRAKWVLDKLVKKLGLTDSKKAAALRERTILLSAGPLHVGQGEEDPTEIKNRAKDRSVEVWVCGGAKT